MDRADAGDPHGHDFLFESHFHAIKRRFVGPGFFMLQVLQQGVCTQIVQHSMYIIGGARNGAVNTFSRQKNQTLDVPLLAKV